MALRLLQIMEQKHKGKNGTTMIQFFLKKTGRIITHGDLEMGPFSTVVCQSRRSVWWVPHVDGYGVAS